MFEQRLLLEDPISRRIFDNAKEDSSSMRALRDSDSGVSWRTHSTQDSSKISRIFQFDAELISSEVYQRAIRSMVKSSRTSGQRQCKLLLLGARDSGKESLMKHFKISPRNHSPSTEMLCYKYSILSVVVDTMRNIVNLLESTAPESTVESSWQRDILFQQVLPIDNLTSELEAAMTYLWEQVMPLVPRLRRSRDVKPMDDATL